jgi:NADH:ubiquinone oxidoreductase subunit E
MDMKEYPPFSFKGEGEVKKSMQLELKTVCEIIEKYGYQKSSLIGILQDIQDEINYLPRKALLQVARSLDIPLTSIYEVATFYKAFSLKPRGRHTIKSAWERHAMSEEEPESWTILRTCWT